LFGYRGHRQADRQTDRQTNAGENTLPRFRGDNNHDGGQYNHAVIGAEIFDGRRQCTADDDDDDEHGGVPRDRHTTSGDVTYGHLSLTLPSVLQPLYNSVHVRR